MPRRMPDFGKLLSSRITIAAQLPATFETLRAHAEPGSNEHKLLHPARIESAYEMAFLRIFIAWEDVLEQSFIRYLCGYKSVTGTQAPATGVTFTGTVSAAESQLYAGSSYLLWHNPQHVINRSRKFFSNGLHEHICQSNFARLTDLASVRHRVAHGQDDSKSKFDAATMRLAGKRYRGSRPGPFLRDWDSSCSPPRRWLDVLAAEFVGLIGQIVP